MPGFRALGVGARRYFFPAACDYPAYAWRFTGQFPTPGPRQKSAWPSHSTVHCPLRRPCHRGDGSAVQEVAMGKPVISVIMATYNHAPFVGEAVSSVLEQTFANFEFLILDDGSTDSTPDRVRAFSDPRIRFTAWPRNRGACAAINTLLDAWPGEYICLLNSDDRFLPNKLERQMLFLRSHPELSFCFTWAELIDDFGRPYVDDRHFYYGLFDQLPRTRQAWLRRFFWEGNCLCHPTIMARRKDYTLRFDERLCKLPTLHMWVRLARRYELGMLPERRPSSGFCRGRGTPRAKRRIPWPSSSWSSP